MLTKGSTIIPAVVSILGLVATVPVRAETRTYAFREEQSWAIYRNWAWGYQENVCSVGGEFRLTVDFDLGVAYFEDANAISSACGGLDVGELFHMTDLESTDVNDVEIHFIYDVGTPETPWQNGYLQLTFAGDVVSLTGGSPFIGPDAGGFDLEAIAVEILGPGDLTGDGEVDLADFSGFTAWWLEDQCGTCGRADLTNDGAVGPDDLAAFGMHWLDGKVREPVINYYASGDCNDLSGQEFTVSPEGRYIRFAGALGYVDPASFAFEMEVSGPQITLWESGDIATPGWYECWLGNAVLGPFAPGDYVVDVYGVFGEFRGSEAVTVEP